MLLLLLLPIVTAKKVSVEGGISADTFATCNGRGSCYADVELTNKENKKDTFEFYTNIYSGLAALKQVNSYVENKEFVSVKKYWEVNADCDPLTNINCSYSLKNKTVKKYVSGYLNREQISGGKVKNKVFDAKEKKLYRLFFEVPTFFNLIKYDIILKGLKTTLLDPFITNNWFTEPFDDKTYINNNSRTALISGGKALIHPVFSDSIFYLSHDIANISANIERNWKSSINNATHIGTSNTSGVLNEARDYTGGATADMTQTSSGVQIGVKNFTISLWYNPDDISATPQVLITNRDSLMGNYDEFWSLHQTTNFIFFGLFTNNCAAQGNIEIKWHSNQTNVWIHIVAMKNGDNLTIYVNGSMVNTIDLSANSIPASCGDDTWVTGSSFINGGATNNFNGQLDEIGVWDYALNQTQIDSLFFVNNPYLGTSGTAFLESTNLSPSIKVASFNTNFSDTNNNCFYSYSGDNVTWYTMTNNTQHFFRTKQDGFFWNGTLLTGCEFDDLNITFNNTYPRATINASDTLFVQDCYQESANVSTSCGGVSSGVYSYNVSEWNALNVSNTFDGSFSTWAVVNSTGLHDYAYLYINYTKPSRATSLSKWLVADETGGSEPDGILRANVTIPLDCWNYNDTTLVLRVLSENNVGSSETYWSCYNGTDWAVQKTNLGNTRVYEEGMNWYINGALSYFNDTVRQGNTTSFLVNISHPNSYYFVYDVNETLDNTCFTVTANYSQVAVEGTTMNSTNITIITSSDCSVGNYTGVITFNETNNENNESITVNLEVQYKDPVVDLSPSVWSASIYDGQDILKEFNITNTGFNTSNCSINTNGTLTPTYTAFNVTENLWTAVNVTFQSVAEGIYNDELYVVCDDQYSTSNVSMSFAVAPAPTPTVTVGIGGGGGGKEAFYTVSNVSIKNSYGGQEYNLIVLSGKTKTSEIHVFNEGTAIQKIKLECRSVVDNSCDTVKISEKTFFEVQPNINPLILNFTYSPVNKTIGYRENFIIVAVDSNGNDISVLKVSATMFPGFLQFFKHMLGIGYRVDLTGFKEEGRSVPFPIILALFIILIPLISFISKANLTMWQKILLSLIVITLLLLVTAIFINYSCNLNVIRCEA